MSPRTRGRVFTGLSVLMVASSLVTDGARSILLAVGGVCFAIAAISSLSGGTR